MNQNRKYLSLISSGIIALIPVLSLWGVSGLFVLLAASLLMLPNFDTDVRLSKIDWGYIAVLCFPVVTVVASMLVSDSWQWRQIDRYIRYPLGALVFFFMLKGRKQALHLDMLKIAFYLASTVGFICALYEKVILGIPLAGSWLFSISFGEIMAIIAVLSLLKFDDTKCNASIWRMLFFTLALLASVMAGTKGAWVAFPLLLWFIFDFHYRKHLGKQIAVFCVSLFVVSILLWSIPFSKQRINQAVSDVTGYFNQEEFHPTSQGLRLMMWDTALDISKDNFWFGVGISEIPEELRDRCQHSSNASVREKYDSYQVYLSHLHNDWLQSLVGQGIFGLLAFICFAFYSAFICFRDRNNCTEEARMWAYFNILTCIAFAIFCCTQCLHAAPRNLWIALSVLSFAGFRRKQLKG